MYYTFSLEAALLLTELTDFNFHSDMNMRSHHHHRFDLLLLRREAYCIGDFTCYTTDKRLMVSEHRTMMHCCLTLHTKEEIAVCTVPPPRIYTS